MIRSVARKYCNVNTKPFPMWSKGTTTSEHISAAPARALAGIRGDQPWGKNRDSVKQPSGLRFLYCIPGSVMFSWQVFYEDLNKRDGVFTR